MGSLSHMKKKCGDIKDQRGASYTGWKYNVIDSMPLQTPNLLVFR